MAPADARTPEDLLADDAIAAMWANANPAAVSFDAWAAHGEAHILNAKGRSYWTKNMSSLLRAWRREYSRKIS